MNQEQLVKKIRYSLNDGFTEDEVRNALRSQGISHSQINQAFRQINSQNNTVNQNNQQRGQNQSNNQVNNQPPGNNQNQGFGGNQQFNNQSNQTSQQNQGFNQRNRGDQASQGAIESLDLTDNSYKIVQNLLLKRYSVFDQRDNKVLKAKKKILSIITDIPFSDPESGEVIFRAKSKSLLNLSHKYDVKNEKTGENLAVLDKKRTLLNQVWKVREPDNESVVAEIQNESTMLQLLRNYGGVIPFLPNPFALAPHNYEITDVSGNQIGELNGQLSIKDKYDLNLQDSGNLDRESMVAAIIAIDALEGN